MPGKPSKRNLLYYCLYLCGIYVSFKIKYISYLDREDKRHRIQADSAGMFRVKTTVTGGRISQSYAFGAKDVVMRLLDWYPSCDPVATLTDRTTVRICQGGQAPPRVEALCLLESHDKKCRCPTWYSTD